jgi:hypothetical protein
MLRFLERIDYRSAETPNVIEKLRVLLNGVWRQALQFCLKFRGTVGKWVRH